MASSFSFTTVLLLLLPVLLHHTSTACHVDEHSALLSFKSGLTQDPSGELSSWVPNTDCCTWAGVSCGRNKRVTQVELMGIRGPLSGTLSTSLAKLRHLNNFIIDDSSNITGPFPTFLSPNLRFLWIENAKLSGPLPLDIGTRFRKLDTLNLNGNQFSGTIPNSLSRATKLNRLYLGGNKLTGPIPPEIGQLKNLGILILENNRLSGSLVKLFNQTTSLLSFSGGGNQFRFNMSDLVIPEQLFYLDLSRNQVYGKVPASVARLEGLDLSHNRLCGQLPETGFQAKAFEGNDCLCGSPLPACKNELCI